MPNDEARRAILDEWRNWSLLGGNAGDWQEPSPGELMLFLGHLKSEKPDLLRFPSKVEHGKQAIAWIKRGPLLE